MATAASIRIPTESAVLNGALQMPAAARGLIAVVHAGTNDSYGKPSSAIDGAITRRGYGTLVVNLLTPAEESAERASGSCHLDVPFLAARVCQVLGALRCHPDCRHEALGIVAEGMAAAGAIVSASHHGEVQAVVSLNGRADLAGDVLKQMSAPTLLLVAKDQRHVVDLNRKAVAQRDLSGLAEISGDENVLERDHGVHPRGCGAVELARRFEAFLHVLHVVDDVAAQSYTTVKAPPDWMPIQAELERQAWANLEAALPEPDRSACRAQLDIAISPAPGRAILSRARDRDIDLIIVGTHGRTGLSRVLLGSVAQHVSASAPCPVLTVHAHERDFVQPDVARRTTTAAPVL